MEDSILITTKKNLGISAEYSTFDIDIITHINSTFSVLSQMGIGPSTGFGIEDETSKWQDFISDNTPVLNLIKSYMFVKVRLLFDPPATSYHLTALKDIAEEQEWRLSQFRELTVSYVPPVV